MSNFKNFINIDGSLTLYPGPSELASSLSNAINSGPYEAVNHLSSVFNFSFT